MLEKYFVRPETVDRFHSSWIAEPIEKYVVWLHDRRYQPRSVFRRVPIVSRFGDFAAARGAKSFEDLPHHVEDFVADWIQRRAHDKSESARKRLGRDVRNPIQQMLRLVLPDFEGLGRPRTQKPFADRVPGFFEYLLQERGLREASIRHYAHHLRPLKKYVDDIGLDDLAALSPVVLSGFITWRCPSLAKTSRRDVCGVLRVFLRYLFREGIVTKDLSTSIERPQHYRLSKIPRSISWEDVKKVLAVIDRRSAVGKRDYAILLLLITYGLRAREVAALKLDHIDWREERLRVPERKAGHSTGYPLSPIVGQALLEYLRHARPTTEDRHVFQRILAPLCPLTHAAVSSRAAHYLKKAGIDVPRPGSHTFRHTCVQRLVEGDFSFKEIGDYVGHRSPASTEIYSKVDLEALRQVGTGLVEELL
ncbi:MAG: tyrosine-type recombinase/integrase [bacterium]|nr:tyrosine-type recombinase/integrase [bacterium]